MSPVAQLSILALASTVLAVPYHGHQHAQFHAPSGYGAASASAPFSYNGTRPYGSSGTGLATTTLSKAAGGYGAQTTITVNAVGSSIAAADYGSSGTSDTCTDDVTVTSTTKTTVYVTATSSASDVSAVVEETTTSAGKVLTLKSTIFSTVHSTVYVTPSTYGSSSAASSAVVSPVSMSSSSAVVSTTSSSTSTSSSSTSTSSSSSPAYTPPAYTPPTSSSAAAPTTSSSSAVAPTTSSPAPPAYTPPASSTSSSSSAAPSTSKQAAANAVVPASYSSSSTTSAAAATSSAASSGSGKRGLAYNDASLLSMFSSSPSVGWAYNWDAITSSVPSNLNYIPMLHDTSSMFASPWLSRATAFLSKGATSHLFSFNEPDLSSGANLSPAAAAAAWKTYMQPFAGQAKLCAPSITNGPAPMGLAWLEEFLSACSGCTIDCLNLHWYAPASQADVFKAHVSNATALAPGKPVYISEFGATGSDDEISGFLKEVMPWMDGNGDVAGYAYFMVAQGKLVSGSAPSDYGATYMSYTG